MRRPNSRFLWAVCMAAVLVVVQLLGCNTNLKELSPASSPSPTNGPAGTTYPIKVRPDGQLEPQLPPQVLQWDPVSGKLVAVPASGSIAVPVATGSQSQQQQQTTYPITVVIPGGQQQQQQSGVSLIGFGQQQQQTGTTTTISGCSLLAGPGQGVLWCQLYGLSTFALDASGSNYTGTMANPMKAILVGSQQLSDLAPGNVTAIRVNVWNRGIAYAGNFSGNVVSWLKANLQVGDYFSISYNLANNGQVWHILLGASFLTSEIANENDGQGGLRLRRNLSVENDPPALAALKAALAKQGFSPNWADLIVGTVR